MAQRRSIDARIANHPIASQTVRVTPVQPTYLQGHSRAYGRDNPDTGRARPPIVPVGPVGGRPKIPIVPVSGTGGRAKVPIVPVRGGGGGGGRTKIPIVPVKQPWHYKDKDPKGGGGGDKDGRPKTHKGGGGGGGVPTWLQDLLGGGSGLGGVGTSALPGATVLPSASTGGGAGELVIFGVIASVIAGGIWYAVEHNKKHHGHGERRKGHGTHGHGERRKKAA
jgi:hypothetical protein